MRDTTEDGKFARIPENPGALVCVDGEGLRAYRLRKRREAEINSLKDTVLELSERVRILAAAIEGKL